MAQGSEPGVLMITGWVWARLRVDDQGITYRNFLRTHRIGWDQVRWITDGLSPVEERLMLRIVLHDGREICTDTATVRGGLYPETLAAIRQAAARHAVPAVLTGATVRQGQPDAAGLYADPGGKPGLREWTGTEWSPFLQVDPASSGPGGGSGPARIWSPVTELEQQRQWDAAASRARRAGIWFAIWLGTAAVAAAVMLAVFVYDLGQPQAGLRWAGWGLFWLGYGALLPLGAWGFRKKRRKAAQAAKRAAELARAEDGTASPVDDRSGDPAAGDALIDPPPAADPAAGAGRISCRECGADSDRATQVCARCGAPLLPLSSL